MSTTEKFIVCAPGYTDDSGGSIVLHKLCDTLNKLGYVCKLWPISKPRFSVRTPITSAFASLAYIGSRTYRGRFTTNEIYDTPLARASDIEGSVVVYPEIVSGNPLAAERYVRWFLHKPGFHKGHFKYKDHDLCFSYQDAFKSTETIEYGGNLTVYEAFLSIYKLTNTRSREKVCYMVRKGRGRPDLPDLDNQCVVDGYSHRELSKIFNECKICYFYDPYTAYATYAAVCGCVPVIVPLAGVSRDQWIPEEDHRFGLAYGDEDIAHAIATRGLMLDGLRVLEQKNADSVGHFVSVVRNHFNQ